MRKKKIKQGKRDEQKKGRTTMGKKERAEKKKEKQKKEKKRKKSEWKATVKDSETQIKDIVDPSFLTVYESNVPYHTFFHGYHS